MLAVMRASVTNLLNSKIHFFPPWVMKMAVVVVDLSGEGNNGWFEPFDNEVHLVDLGA